MTSLAWGAPQFNLLQLLTVFRAFLASSNLTQRASSRPSYSAELRFILVAIGAARISKFNVRRSLKQMWWHLMVMSVSSTSVNCRWLTQSCKYVPSSMNLLRSGISMMKSVVKTCPQSRVRPLLLTTEYWWSQCLHFSVWLHSTLTVRAVQLLYTSDLTLDNLMM